MILLEILALSCFEGPVVWSPKSDDRKFGPISGNRFPDGSVYRGVWGIPKGNRFLGLLFLFWSLGHGVGVFVISERLYLVVGGNVSEHEADLGFFLSLLGSLLGFLVLLMVNQG